MKRAWFTAAVLGATIAAGVVRADDAQVRAELGALYQRIDAATDKKDIKTIVAFMSPDFTTKTNGKVFTRKQSVDALAGEIKTLLTITTDPTVITGLKMVNGKATVTTKASFDGILIAAGGQSHEIIEKTTNVDVWVKTSQGWRIKSETVTSESTTLDGQPFHVPKHK